MSQPPGAATIIQPFQPNSRDARLAQQASDDTLRAALHGVDPDAVFPHRKSSAASSSSSATSTSHHNEEGQQKLDPQQQHQGGDEHDDAKYPVSWQLSAVREELAETRNGASRLRRQIGARDSDCALLEARIVDAGKRRKEIEGEITEQLKRRSRVTQLTHTTENQKKKIIHGQQQQQQERSTSAPSSGSSSSTTHLGRPLGVEKPSSRLNSTASRSSPSSQQQGGAAARGGEQQQQDDDVFIEFQTASREDERRLQEEEEMHGREIAELRYRHRLFREEIIKWQKKRRILENSSLKMSCQADDEKFFDVDTVKQRKAERKLLLSAERIRDIRKGERDTLEAQNRDVSKHLGEIRMRLRDAEEELAAKRRQMEKLRLESARVQKDVSQARQDTAQSVILAQEALEKVRFEEQKALRETQQRQREAADRARAAAMDVRMTATKQPASWSSSSSSPAVFTGSVGVPDQLRHEQRQVVSESEQEIEPKGEQQQQQDGEEEQDESHASLPHQFKKTCQAASAAASSTGVSPPRKLPRVPLPSIVPPPSYHPTTTATTAAAAPSPTTTSNSYQQFRQSFIDPNQHEERTMSTAVTDQSYQYKIYNSETDDPRDAWYTLAPRDGASTDELFNELTRIVRTVAVEFGKPELELLKDI